MSALRQGRIGIDRALRWGLVVTIVLSVAALVGGTMSTYRATPPIPDHVIAPDGTELFGKADILAGRAVFQRADLMDFGSLYGNGAYLGPDWGDDYLHREVAVLRSRAAARSFATTYASLTGAQRREVDGHVVEELKANRYSPPTGTLVLSTDQVTAYEEIAGGYRDLSEGS